MAKQPNIEIPALPPNAAARAAECVKLRSASAAEYELSEARRRAERQADYDRDQRTQAAITAEEQAVSERLDAAHAADIIAALAPLVEEWREEPSRPTETAIVEVFSRFAPRAETEIGAPLAIERLLMVAFYRSEIARRPDAADSLGRIDALSYGVPSYPGPTAARAAEHIAHGNVPALRAALTELEQSIVALASRPASLDPVQTEIGRKRLELFGRFATRLNHARGLEAFERAAEAERQAAAAAENEAHRLRFVRHRAGDEVGLTPDEATAAESFSLPHPFGALTRGVRRAAAAIMGPSEDTEKGLRALEAAGSLAPSRSQ
jgi:hypothetical protein